MEPFQKEIEQASSFIHSCDAILVGAGAGMGVDSGLPDFRGNDGFWKAYPPLAKMGIKFHEMANPKWFSDEPNLAWGFYGHRLKLYQKTVPHRGFNILLEKNTVKKIPMFIFTSNVDGHFQKTGFTGEQIVECHGSIMHLQCTEACGQSIWRVESDFKLNIDPQNLQAKNPLPLCPSCGSIARPNILMFSDWEWLQERTARQTENLTRWLEQYCSPKLLVLELGAGTSIPTVRSVCEEVTHSSKGTMIRVYLRDAGSNSKQTISIPHTTKDTLERISNN